MEAHLASLAAFVVIAVLVAIIFGTKRLRQAVRSSMKSLRNEPQS